eukprot:1160951-Pelagomonas_calceolata.AAC.9
MPGEFSGLLSQAEEARGDDKLGRATLERHILLFARVILHTERPKHAAVECYTSRHGPAIPKALSELVSKLFLGLLGFPGQPHIL